MSRLLRCLGATAIVGCVAGMGSLPASASDLPSSASTIFDQNFSSSTPPSSLTALTVAGTQSNVPCLSAATSGSRNFQTCDVKFSLPSGASDALVLDDGLNGTSGSGIVSTTLSSTSSTLFAQTYATQRGSRGAQTLWLVDGSTNPTTIPGTTRSGGYGDASGGIPNAIVGVTFDAAGTAAQTNGASCPSVGWSSASSKANQVVVRGGSDSTGKGFCFIASTNQPVNSVANTSPVGSLSSTSPTDGWQRYVVAIIPPSHISLLPSSF